MTPHSTNLNENLIGWRWRMNQRRRSQSVGLAVTQLSHQLISCATEYVGCLDREDSPGPVPITVVIRIAQ